MIPIPTETVTRTNGAGYGERDQLARGVCAAGNYDHHILLRRRPLTATYCVRSDPNRSAADSERKESRYELRDGTPPIAGVRDAGGHIANNDGRKRQAVRAAPAPPRQNVPPPVRDADGHIASDDGRNVKPSGPRPQEHPTLTVRDGSPPILGATTVLPTGRRRVRPTIPPVRSPRTRHDSACARRWRSVPGRARPAAADAPPTVRDADGHIASDDGRNVKPSGPRPPQPRQTSRPRQTYRRPRAAARRSLRRVRRPADRAAAPR